MTHLSTDVLLPVPITVTEGKTKKLLTPKILFHNVQYKSATVFVIQAQQLWFTNIAFCSNLGKIHIFYLGKISKQDFRSELAQCATRCH